MGATLAHAAPAGYAYYDPYCHEDFATLEVYRSHLYHHHHPGIVRVIEEDLRIEDEIANEAIAKIDSYKRDIPYGSDEWRLLFERFFREIAERRGYVS